MMSMNGCERSRCAAKWILAAGLVTIMFMLLLPGESIACEPWCGDCYYWNTGTQQCEPVVCSPGYECCGDACIEECTGCQSCNSMIAECADSEYLCTGACQDCDEGDCKSSCTTGQECCGGACITECVSSLCMACGPSGSCELSCITGQECCGGNCITKCESTECKECDGAGSCKSTCDDPDLPACSWGICVECVDILDCDLCEECVGYKCVHPCDDCVWPKYCGNACACVECYPGDDDTTTCSTLNNDLDECGCSMNIFNPCSGTEMMRVYTGNVLESCTGPDCTTYNDVLCYTTYEKCVASGIFKPLQWCIAGTCEIDLEHPGPGCYGCGRDPYETGVPTYETRGVCPADSSQ
jgi:hypothetical protein